jgi:hypothetical protein
VVAAGSGEGEGLPCCVPHNFHLDWEWKIWPIFPPILVLLPWQGLLPIAIVTTHTAAVGCLGLQFLQATIALPEQSGMAFE